MPAQPTPISHRPAHYNCPFCSIAREDFDVEALFTAKTDIVLHTDTTVAFVSSHWWPNNPGHVLIIPIKHIENIYDLPKALAADIHEATRRVALAMRRAYGCPGTSTRQHNEPAGGQDVWHYHVHLFPRFPKDGLYAHDSNRSIVSAEKRRAYAERLREALTEK